MIFNFSQLIYSEIMCEFIPFCPFSSNNLIDDQSQANISLLKQQSQTYQSDSSLIDQNYSQHSHPSSSKSKRQDSVNHNMVKQLIITIKQMMNPIIRDICSGQVKKAVHQIWHIFTNHRQANKEILKALFDETLNLVLVAKYGFDKVIQSYGIEVFKGAIEALRHHILYKMKNQTIKSHLLDRRVQNKERLQAFILYFLNEELSKGQIAYRQGERATEKIQKILQKLREEQVFIDNFFSSSEEVIERFASINNEIS